MEIECKFNLSSVSFILQPEFKKNIATIKKTIQGYVYSDQCITRYQVNTYPNDDMQGFIIIKSAKEEFERDEYVLSINFKDAKKLIDKYCGDFVIHKYRVVTKDHWEIDIFDGRPLGLFIAEKELDLIDEEINIPEPLSFFVNREVTAIPYFYNQNIAKRRSFCFADKRKELARKIIKEIWP